MTSPPVRSAAEKVAPRAFDAVLLSGGDARRLGGVAKADLVVGGRRLIDRVLDAVAAAELVVVVGPDPGNGRVDAVTREDPPGSGPVAAIAAGLAYVRAPIVAVLAADLPFLDPATIGRLVDALAPTGASLPGSRPADVAALVDSDGRDQNLVTAWRTARLRALLACGPTLDTPVRSLLRRARVRRVACPARPGPPVWWDCDTERELDEARRWV